MTRLAIGFMVAALASGAMAQQAKQNRPSTPPKTDAGMVVTGDQEAPLVLTIVPWQEPKQLPPPPVSVAPIVPVVLDHERGVAEDPLSRPLPAR